MLWANGFRLYGVLMQRFTKKDKDTTNNARGTRPSIRPHRHRRLARRRSAEDEGLERSNEPKRRRLELGMTTAACALVGDGGCAATQWPILGFSPQDMNASLRRGDASQADLGALQHVLILFLASHLCLLLPRPLAYLVACEYIFDERTRNQDLAQAHLYLHTERTGCDGAKPSVPDLALSGWSSRYSIWTNWKSACHQRWLPQPHATTAYIR